MATVESLICALDIRNPSNSLSIASAKPSQEIRVLVCPEDDATAKLMEAFGTLSNDGKSFSCRGHKIRWHAADPRRVLQRSLEGSLGHRLN